ncbi:MAG: hypothetical protein K2P58_00960 [Hyphomonadaceae bacterium]|nr:hypothetical protein [Hyphomonadaceae bacterium]
MRALIAGLSLVFLAACGFQPMYAPPGGGAAIGPVEVNEIDGKAGHVLRTELTRLLAVEAGGGAASSLQVTLSEQVVRLGIRRDETATRAEIRLTANYILTPPNAPAMRGALTSVANYDIPQAAFGEIAAQDDARERAAETLAQRFRAELALRMAQSRARGAAQ